VDPREEDGGGRTSGRVGVPPPRRAQSLPTRVKSSCAERSGSMEEGDDGRAEGTRRVDPAPCTVDPREEDGGGASSTSRAVARVSAGSPWRGSAEEASGWCGVGRGRARLDRVDNINERSR
jgi:hypothetical protein